MNWKRMVIMLIAFMLVMGSMEYTNVSAATNDVFYISAGGKQLKVRMEDNESARELKRFFLIKIYPSACQEMADLSSMVT